MSNESMNAKYMSIDNVLACLSSHKDYCENYAAGPDTVWQNTVDALESAICIISALQDEGVNDAEGLKDLIFDYGLLSKQHKELHRKFEVPAKAIRKDDVWHCPECNHRVMPRHSFCHWCGKKLGGW